MNQLADFDPEFVTRVMDEWRVAAENYHKHASNAYSRLRSYLTLYQFRLNEDKKCQIREKLSQMLDEIESNDELVKDMDSYLAGFCFRLDKSIVSNKMTKIKTKQPVELQTKSFAVNESVHDSTQTENDQNEAQVSETMHCETFDDLDFYTLQFFQ